MRNATIFTAIIVGMMTWCSCSNSSNEGESQPKYITIDASISNGNTRVQYTDETEKSQEFTDGDVISIYAWIGDSKTVDTGNLVVNDSRNTLSSGTWSDTPQMLWKNTTSSHYFLGIYPARSVSDFTADSYTLNTKDQTTSDLLVATKTTGVVATNNPVSLEFQHLMAKLVVNLSFRNQWGGTPTVEKVICYAADNCTINYLATSQISAGGETTEIEIPMTDANTKYTSIMVPQSSFQKVSVVIGDKTYTYDHGSTIDLSSGKITYLNLIVGRDQIDLGTISINDWEDGETYTGGWAEEE